MPGFVIGISDDPYAGDPVEFMQINEVAQQVIDQFAGAVLPRIRKTKSRKGMKIKYRWRYVEGRFMVIKHDEGNSFQLFLLLEVAAGEEINVSGENGGDIIFFYYFEC